MDPTTGKLFGAIGKAERKTEPSEDSPAFLAATTDPDFSRHYVASWRKAHNHDDKDADGSDSQQASA